MGGEARGIRLAIYVLACFGCVFYTLGRWFGRAIYCMFTVLTLRRVVTSGRTYNSLLLLTHAFTRLFTSRLYTITSAYRRRLRSVWRRRTSVWRVTLRWRTLTGSSVRLRRTHGSGARRASGVTGSGGRYRRWRLRCGGRRCERALFYARTSFTIYRRLTNSAARRSIRLRRDRFMHHSCKSRLRAARTVYKRCVRLLCHVCCVCLPRHQFTNHSSSSTVLRARLHARRHASPGHRFLSHTHVRRYGRTSTITHTVDGLARTFKAVFLWRRTRFTGGEAWLLRYGSGRLFVTTSVRHTSLTSVYVYKVYYGVGHHQATGDTLVTNTNRQTLSGFQNNRRIMQPICT